MNRKAFYHLLKRYVEDDCTEEEKKLVEQWYELLGDDEELNPAMSAGEIKETLQRLWPKIQQQTILAENNQPPLPRTKGLRVTMRQLTAAAVIAGLMLTALWLLNDKETGQQVNPRSATTRLSKTNNSNTLLDTLLLHDGSMVILEPRSRIYYPENFDSLKREVYLEGNAFFKVARNPKCPFFVYSRNIVTQVLGTSFSVKTNPLKTNVEVSVRTGKVAVYEYRKDTIQEEPTEESKGVILHSNQKVIYNEQDHHFRTTIVERPLPVAVIKNAEDTITELNFVFDETPVAKVLKRLEQAYHIEMVPENETLANCLFSGDIKGQHLFDQLEIICAAVQATYEIRGTRILIKGSGCE